MTLKAVIFGSIGSFSETSLIQLESFNEALSQNGLKQQWDEKEYIAVSYTHLRAHET